ncbi:unnamed protein product [Sphagnum troendelagicum]|uniref:Uncharacterized protein n=1 Tax=Sphagnum troendelagicum TaxID=128251 RepID=A0ABP0U4S4_9BRYO
MASSMCSKSEELPEHQIPSEWPIQAGECNQAVICQKRMFPHVVYPCQDMKLRGTGRQATIYSISMEEVVNNNTGEVAPSSNSYTHKPSGHLRSY